jgi:hypothetical protein
MPERLLLKLIPSRPNRLLLTATLIIGVSASGCGSSNKSATSATTASITKAELLAKGNAICAHGNQKLAGAQSALGSRPSQAQITAFVKSSLGPDIQSQIDGIRALGAPSGEQSTVTSMLGVAQKDLDKLESNPALLASGPPFADFAKIAHSYGLTACAANN